MINRNSQLNRNLSFHESVFILRRRIRSRFDRSLRGNRFDLSSSRGKKMNRGAIIPSSRIVRIWLNSIELMRFRMELAIVHCEHVA